MWWLCHLSRLAERRRHFQQNEKVNKAIANLRQSIASECQTFQYIPEFKNRARNRSIQSSFENNTLILKVFVHICDKRLYVTFNFRVRLIWKEGEGLIFTRNLSQRIPFGWYFNMSQMSDMSQMFKSCWITELLGNKMQKHC